MCHDNQKVYNLFNTRDEKTYFFANKNHFENFVYVVPEMTLVSIIKGGISLFSQELDSLFIFHENVPSVIYSFRHNISAIIILLWTLEQSSTNII